MTFADQIIAFNQSLSPDWDIPEPVELLYPYDRPETMAALTTFYQKYYGDRNSRICLFGINPGRFGAAVTGVPFTDPIRLESVCGIDNPFSKKPELSSVFVYEFIEAFGGVEAFYPHFCITSLCPLGFVKDGKNYNYYDDRELEERVTPHIVDHLHTLLDFPVSNTVALCLGRGKNYEYFRKLNDTHRFFGEVIPLPHPRWVMQYRRKRMEEFVQEYLTQLRYAIDAAASAT
ncbi:uracil-DNA glycosylase family protein [Flavilitoribacter nigricans]|nr:uracil-DNA glycosylase family protein [Flavilitoribacter nigricans]